MQKIQIFPISSKQYYMFYLDQVAQIQKKPKKYSRY
jgi:hypothetical protein